MSSQLKRWSVWHRGIFVADAVEYRHPELKIRQAEYFGGQMDGPRIIDNGMEPLIASIKIRGANVSDFIAIGFRPFFSSRFIIREGYSAPGGGVGLEDELEGFISGIAQDPLPETGRADKATVVTLSLTYYRRSVGNQEKLLLIPGEGVRRVNGIDSLNVVSALVYLSSLPGGADDVDFKNLKSSDFIGEGF